MRVELVNYTPNPVETAGRAAGICYDKEEKEDYASFLKRVIGMGHESVIEHVSFTFKISEVSRALTHQLVRHRIASYSQRSQRFVDEGEFNYVIPPTIKNNKEASKLYEDFMTSCERTYGKLRAMGIPKQDSRFVLPNACHTKIVVTMNARSLRHFLKLRMEKHAQWEIRELACKIYDLASAVAPPLFEDLKELRETGEPSREWEEGDNW